MPKKGAVALAGSGKDQLTEKRENKPIPGERCTEPSSLGNSNRPVEKTAWGCSNDEKGPAELNTNGERVLSKKGINPRRIT